MLNDLARVIACLEEEDYETAEDIVRELIENLRREQKDKEEADANS